MNNCCLKSSLIVVLYFLGVTCVWAENDIQRMQLNGNIKMLTSYRVQSKPIQYDPGNPKATINPDATTLDGKAKEYEFLSNGLLKAYRIFRSGEVLYFTGTYEHNGETSALKKIDINGKLLEERIFKIIDNGSKRETHVKKYDKPVEFTKIDVLDEKGRAVERQLARIGGKSSGNPVTISVTFSKLIVKYNEQGKKVRQVQYRIDEPEKIRRQKDFFYDDRGFLKRTEENDHVRDRSSVFHFITDEHGNWIFKYQINQKPGQVPVAIVKRFREIEYFNH